jgi:hypothetical protein
MAAGKGIDEYAREIPLGADAERIFDAVGTVQGPRSWWTPIVAGSAVAGGTLMFGFEGMDESVVMHVDEVTRPSRVRWTCLGHTGAPEWAGTSLIFDVADDGPGRAVLRFRHAGLAAEHVAHGWNRFLASLASYVETGQGQPYGQPDEALRTARAYHTAWTRHDFAAAAHLLAEDLRTDVPLNTYESREEFVAALTGFGSIVDRVDVVAELAGGSSAVLIYDMHTRPYGVIRVAEQFTVRDGRIRHIRHVHDTAALRAAA